MLKPALVSALTASLILACAHPLEIVNEGDIVSASGTRDCSLPEFRARLENCRENLVTEAYQETYTAVPRRNWVFDRWEGCFSDPEVPTCSFSISEEVVKENYFKTMPPLRALFRRDGPQQYATRYVYWNLPGTPPTIARVDQDVWIAQAGASTFLPLFWNWSGAIAQAGSLAIAQGADRAEDAQVQFSISNGIDASGDNCRVIEGRSSGRTCTLAVTIDTTRFYRFRLLRVASDFDGHWWGAWLVAQDESGALVSHAIGRIKVTQRYSSIDPSSLLNYVQYAGDSVPRCREVPLSQTFFSPPAINYSGPGAGYAAFAEFDRSETTAYNTCSLVSGGDQPVGALTREFPMESGPEPGRGVTIYLGGDQSADRPEPPDDSFPERLPDG